MFPDCCNLLLDRGSCSVDFRLTQRRQGVYPAPCSGQRRERKGFDCFVSIVMNINKELLHNPKVGETLF